MREMQSSSCTLSSFNGILNERASPKTQSGRATLRKSQLVIRLGCKEATIANKNKATVCRYMQCKGNERLQSYHIFSTNMIPRSLK